MEIIEKIFKPVGDLISVSPLVAMFICIGVLALIIVAIIVIVKCVRKGKKNAKAMRPVKVEEVAVTTSKPVQTEPIKPEDTVIETPILVTEKKPTAKKPTAPKREPIDAAAMVSSVKIVVGKWVIEHKSEDEYLAKLLASNGEVMLTSEIYKTEDGARAGVESICRWVENGKFVIYQDKNDNYFYKLKTAGNRLLCVGEIYKAKDQCVKAVESVKRIASASPISKKLVVGKEYIKYTPEKLDADEIKNSAKGKWRIEKNAQGEFSAKLYANNGQLMLATEDVVLKKSAENAIESVKKNAALGLFIIDRDKFGRYYYKLRNSQKSVICIGEAYESLDSCVNAIESVRRFAANTDDIAEEK